MGIVKVKILILMLRIMLVTFSVIKIVMVQLGYLKNTLKRMMRISLITNIESNEMIAMKNKRKIIIKEVTIQTSNIKPMGLN